MSDKPDGRVARGRMPESVFCNSSADTFSYGLRSKCADLDELLHFFQKKILLRRAIFTKESAIYQIESWPGNVLW